VDRAKADQALPQATCLTNFQVYGAYFLGKLPVTCSQSGTRAPGPSAMISYSTSSCLYASRRTRPRGTITYETRRRSNFLPFHSSVAAVHLRNALSKFHQSRGGEAWVTGQVEQSWYTMASCNLECVQERPLDGLVCLESLLDVVSYWTRHSMLGAGAPFPLLLSSSPAQSGVFSA